MKKIIMSMGIMLMSYCAFSGNPPAAVQKAFNQQFAKATDVKWGKESTNEWEAEFKLGGAGMSANYSAEGTWLETEKEMKADQLPDKVSEFISKTYPGWAIVGASKIETLKKGILYEADLKSGTKKKEVTVTSEGIPTK
jgi:hypothetical protein